MAKVPLTEKQVKMLKALARTCKRYQVTLQADGDVLMIGGVRLAKVSPLGSYALLPHDDSVIGREIRA